MAFLRRRRKAHLPTPVGYGSTYYGYTYQVPLLNGFDANGGRRPSEVPWLYLL